MRLSLNHLIEWVGRAYSSSFLIPVLSISFCKVIFGVEVLILEVEVVNKVVEMRNLFLDLHLDNLY